MEVINNRSIQSKNDKEEVIRSLIKKLKNKELYYFDVPEEYRLNIEIVKVQRDLCIRQSLKKGFDVIKMKFFVEELVVREHYDGELSNEIICNYFDDFSSYYEFLIGDIYNNACYYQYDFSSNIINKYSIDVKRINKLSLINDTIDIYSLDFSAAELEEYAYKEKEKSQLQKTLKKLKACKKYSDFYKILHNAQSKNIFNFLFFNYMREDISKNFDFVMRYINENYSDGLEKSLCLMYNSQKIIEAFIPVGCSQPTVDRYKKQLNYFVDKLKCNEILYSYNGYFDKATHFYVYHCSGRIASDSTITVETYQYFNTFEEMAHYLNNDLSLCDLSNAIIQNLDLSKYIIGNQTKLPIQYQKNTRYKTKKYYNRYEDKFIVEQQWIDENEHIIKSYYHSFKCFFDFAYFLNNDLSNADLIFCDGLSNISNLNQFCLENTFLRSSILDKLGIKYDLFLKNTDEVFKPLQQNEKDTLPVLTETRLSLSFEEELKCQKIYYVTDIHLWHKLRKANCKNLSDAIYIIQRIIDNLMQSIQWHINTVILIGGDTASDFTLFELFVKRLRQTIDEKKYNSIQIIFTLGNHELWDFYGLTFVDIVEKYNSVLNDNGMYLLQNNLIAKFDNNVIKQISTNELLNLSQQEIEQCLLHARLIFFGGIGFSGKNEEFNANQGIYRRTINREQEIQESKIFSHLYDRICTLLPDKRVVVFTHMPPKDWGSQTAPQNNFVYVNGHTHKNYFYDDGVYRIYADNQIGYHQNNCSLKFFYLDDDYDVFTNYENGIYEITREDYVAFYHGKKIAITFSRDFRKLYMLKKNGYYMFILESNNGNLNILNGGSMKRLSSGTVHYYFEFMDKVVAHIKTPLDTYSQLQKQIAERIKSVGGSGRIHGAIVDIDFFNHIYVNPIDSTITPYFAIDIQKKIVFPDVLTLLQNNCPSLYANYLDLIQGNRRKELTLENTKSNKKVHFYLDTDIYKASREIKKMQKLQSNILSTWVDASLKITDGAD